MFKKEEDNLLTDEVYKPPHYTQHPSKVECIDITRHENFNCGNAIKYIWRRNLKGREVQDLKKAIFYLEDEIRRLGGVPEIDHHKVRVMELEQDVTYFQNSEKEYRDVPF